MTIAQHRRLDRLEAAPPWRDVREIPTPALEALVARHFGQFHDLEQLRALARAHTGDDRQ